MKPKPSWFKKGHNKKFKLFCPKTQFIIKKFNQ